MNRRSLASITGLLLLLLVSCNKEKTSNLSGNWLFPIAKGTVSLNDLSELKNLKYIIDVPAVSIGQPVNVPVSSPGLSLDHVGPFPIEISPWLHRIDLDSLNVTGSLNNIFPIPIGAGTKISIRNTPDVTSTTNIVGSTTIANTIMPGVLFSFQFTAYSKTLGDSAYITLDNFTSPAYNNVTFSTTPTKLEITLKFIASSYVEIYSNKTFTSRDTVDFSAGSDDQLGNSTGGVVSDTSVTGYVNVFLDNGFPANTVFQTYLLDDSRTHIIDSLFSTPLTVAGATTDAAGNTLTTVSVVNKVAITKKRINNIKAAKYAITSFWLNTNGYTTPWVAVNKTAKLSIQLTGDLNIRISF